MVYIIVPGLIGVLVGFIVAMYVMRWGVSDLRERASRAIRFKNQAEEIVENQNDVIKKLRAELRAAENHSTREDRQCLTQYSTSATALAWLRNSATRATLLRSN